jgi:hypothetical protein
MQPVGEGLHHSSPRSHDDAALALRIAVTILIYGWQTIIPHLNWLFWQALI